jgi:geranylgeranyl diphosphate synthase type II
MKNLTELRKLLEDYQENNSFTRAPRELYEPANYMMNLGGKRLRPLLALVAYQMFRPSYLREALPIAHTVEVFHNFTLVHDDIMDDAPIRRGKPTVHTKWNDNTAILSGDVMLIAAYESLMTFKDEGRLSRLVRVFNRVAREVCEGQQMDMNFEQRGDVSIEDYLHMIELKTAVLLGGSLEMGAIAAHAKEKDVTNLSEFGRYIGIAFQLQDDILDTFGDADKFGKRIGGDIVQNKKTFLLLKAMKEGTGQQSKRLRELYSEMPADEEAKIDEVTHIFRDIGIHDIAAAERDKFRDKAFGHLEEVQVAEEEKGLLHEMTDLVITREH